MENRKISVRPQDANLKRDAGPGRPKGSQNKITRAAKELAEEILDNEYLERLAARIKAGKAPHMETLLWGYAKGKPKGDEDDNPRNVVLNILTILGSLPQDTLKQIKEAMTPKALPPGE